MYTALLPSCSNRLRCPIRRFFYPCQWLKTRLSANYIVSDFPDPDNTAALADELTSRFGAMRQIGGRAFTALSGELGGINEPGTVLAQAASVNNQHTVPVPRMESPRLPGGALLPAIFLRMIPPPTRIIRPLPV